MSLMNAERQREGFARGPGPATVRIPDAHDSALQTAACRRLRGDFPAVPHRADRRNSSRAALERTRGAKVDAFRVVLAEREVSISAPPRLGRTQSSQWVDAEPLTRSTRRGRGSIPRLLPLMPRSPVALRREAESPASVSTC